MVAPKEENWVLGAEVGGKQFCKFWICTMCSLPIKKWNTKAVNEKIENILQGTNDIYEKNHKNIKG